MGLLDFADARISRVLSWVVWRSISWMTWTIVWRWWIEILGKFGSD
jgi:hypothetical protein